MYWKFSRRNFLCSVKSADHLIYLRPTDWRWVMTAYEFLKSSEGTTLWCDPEKLLSWLPWTPTTAVTSDTWSRDLLRSQTPMCCIVGYEYVVRCHLLCLYSYKSAELGLRFLDVRCASVLDETRAHIATLQQMLLTDTSIREHIALFSVSLLSR